MEDFHILYCESFLSLGKNIETLKLEPTTSEQNAKDRSYFEYLFQLQEG